MEDSKIIKDKFLIREINSTFKKISKQFNNQNKLKKTKLEKSFLSDSSYSEDNVRYIDSLLKRINNDSNYQYYKVQKEKMQRVNRENFPSLTEEFTIKADKGIRPRSQVIVKKKKNITYDKEKFYNMAKKYQKEKINEDSIEYEDQFSSSNSYDSDLNPFINQKISEVKNKTNEIKKNKITTSIQSRIKNDIVVLTNLLEVLENNK